MKHKVKRVVVLDSTRVEVTFEDDTRTVVVLPNPISISGAFTVKKTKVYYNGKLLFDAADYYLSTEVC